MRRLEPRENNERAPDSEHRAARDAADGRRAEAVAHVDLTRRRRPITATSSGPNTDIRNKTRARTVGRCRLTLPVSEYGSGSRHGSPYFAHSPSVAMLAQRASTSSAHALSTSCAPSNTTPSTGRFRDANSTDAHSHLTVLVAHAQHCKRRLVGFTRLTIQAARQLEIQLLAFLHEREQKPAPARVSVATTPLFRRSADDFALRFTAFASSMSLHF